MQKQFSKWFMLLAWIAFSPGVLHAAPAPQTIINADFAKTNPATVMVPSPMATLTTEPGQEVGGSASVLGSAMGSAVQWNEFFHSVPGLFKPNEAYRVSFDYKIIASKPNAGFYALLRRVSRNGQSVDFTNLSNTVGATGHASLHFATHSASDFYLIIGIQNQGEMAINHLVVKTDPQAIPITPVQPNPVRLWTAKPNTNYYVDSVRGKDSNSGLSPAHPWQSLAHLNNGTFAPGDKILLRAGSQWIGFLDPGGSGTPSNPIVLSKYGTGPLPSMDARGLDLGTLDLDNVDCWHVSDLDISNTGPMPEPNLMGVSVDEQDFGTARDIVLAHLAVHNVTGSDVKADGGGSGINCSCGQNKTMTRFDGLTIKDCIVRHTDRNGITMSGNWGRSAAAWYPSLHVQIIGNHLYNIGGDGIVPIACDGAIVAHNVLAGGRMRAKDYAAGIWPWGCDNTIVEYNTVSGMKGTKDAEGYDSDYDCRNSLFQYNVSHNNDGGFMLICDDGSQGLPNNIGNQGTIIRDNISIDDGNHTFTITGPCQNTAIYNNDLYIGKDQNISIINSGNWGGTWPNDTRFTNNLFDVAGKASFSFGGMTKTVFDHNCFWGNISNIPADPHDVLANPLLKAPGTLNLTGYRPQPASPLLKAGMSLPHPGPHGFGGGAWPETPAIGAYQTP